MRTTHVTRATQSERVRLYATLQEVSSDGKGKSATFDVVFALEPLTGGMNG
jgi:hypothetical protein